MISSFLLADMIEKNEEIPLVKPKRKINQNKAIDNLKNTAKNLITLKTPRCTHLGCALKWNEIDNVYECPCHGSRYDRNGKLLNGPARKNLR